jgi:hypothetical protein
LGHLLDQVRPNEGDLIYFPLNDRCFEIKFVNKYEMFYQLGALQTWEVTCELFEYSNETFNTGIPEIDIIQSKFSMNALDFSIKDEADDYLVTEDSEYIILEGKAVDDLIPADDSDEIQQESDNMVLFSTEDPFSEGNI